MEKSSRVLLHLNASLKRAEEHKFWLCSTSRASSAAWSSLVQRPVSALGRGLIGHMVWPGRRCSSLCFLPSWKLLSELTGDWRNTIFFKFTFRNDYYWNWTDKQVLWHEDVDDAIGSCFTSQALEGRTGDSGLDPGKDKSVCIKRTFPSCNWQRCFVSDNHRLAIH